MNQVHLEFLSSPEWALTLQEEVLPWVQEAGDLGDDVLELGPGPGLTTDLLSRRVARLTAVELDPALAGALRERLSGTNVTVVNADATGSGLAGERFSSVVCFSMLHHVPSVPDQDLVFAEAYRALRPGGRFLGTDALDIEATRQLHVGDVFLPLPPSTLGDRLEAAGFGEVVIETTDHRLRFTARKV
ncbi:MAG: class I SAM-dependent methyltransferase [Acidimicrobiales bacterium]|jgi:SAM-dependent methyltransferase